MADKKISQLTASTLPLAGTEVLPIVQSGVTKKVASDDLTVKNLRSNATTGLLQMAGVTAGQTRVVTVPDANFTAARIDAGQTFTGTQLMSGALGVGTASPTGKFTVSNGGAYGVEFDVVNQFVTSYDRTANAWSRLYFRASEYTFNLSGSNNALAVSTAGNVTVGSGNLVIGTAGKGIDFSADPSAAGMTSELLDDYEEGTWTATLTPLTSGTITLSANTCTYTKVGRLVTVNGQINTSAVSSPTGRLRIGTLPFTSASGTSFESVATIRVAGAVAVIAIDALLPNAGNYIDIYPAGTSTDTYASNIDASTQVIFSAKYFV